MASLDNTLGAFTVGGGAGRAIVRQRAYDAGVRHGAAAFDAYDDGASLDEVRDAYRQRIRRESQRAAFADGYRAGWVQRLKAGR